MSLSKEEVLEAIAEMSVMDVVDLVSAMEEKFGVSAAAAVAVAPAVGAGGDDAGGRSRFNHRRWHPEGLRDVDDPAGRSHYMQSRQIETTDRLFEA